MLKEKDKLEKQALVERMRQRDLEATKKRVGSVVENTEIAGSLDELKQMAPDLRKASRQAYLKQREEQVLDLYKRNLDDEKRVFGDQKLTSIEARLNDLKTNLFDLA